MISSTCSRRRATPQGFTVLDVAGGTGDIAFRIAEPSGAGTRITVADISPEMIAEGKRRASARALGEKCDFTVGNAESLPFPDKSFDAYTIAFGIRNVHADRQGARRSLSRAEARRAFPVSRILACRGAGDRPRSMMPIP